MKDNIKTNYELLERYCASVGANVIISRNIAGKRSKCLSSAYHGGSCAGCEKNCVALKASAVRAAER